MDSKFCEALVKKKVICKGTVLNAAVTKEGVGGVRSPGIANVIVEQLNYFQTGRLNFTCKYPDTQQYTEIIPSQIFTVDGMVPERLGKIFNINLDGTLRAPGKKRGRKPKK